MRKRILAMLLCVLMLFSLLPVGAFAEGENADSAETGGAEETPRAVNVAPPGFHELDDDDGELPF